jgi:hypothetical protein
MQWESLGFKGDPLSTDPIHQSTLALYVGHQRKISKCQNVLSQKNILLVIEGERGVGTTSFANYLRFGAQAKHDYLTPRNEIRVEADWRLETLLGVVIGNIVRELDLFHHEQVANDQRFRKAKALSMSISEAYRSFGVEAFGFGVNYGKSAGVSSQPTTVSSATLGHHLEDLSALVQSLGYRYGTLIQLNNLDIGTIHEERHMQYLFNALRDYVQTDGISWILVGDIGLRRFIAQAVDRLDDIINYEVEITALNETDYEALIIKRVTFYRNNANTILPIDFTVFSYLYTITKGRLRYIFGLIQRLMHELSVGDLTDRITLNIAKPVIIELAKDRIKRNHLTLGEEQILKTLVRLERANTSLLKEETGKTTQYISPILVKLVKAKLATVHKLGRRRYYSPMLDAVIAYSAD